MSSIAGTFGPQLGHALGRRHVALGLVCEFEVALAVVVENLALINIRGLSANEMRARARAAKAAARN